MDILKGMEGTPHSVTFKREVNGVLRQAHKFVDWKIQQGFYKKKKKTRNEEVQKKTEEKLQKAKILKEGRHKRESLPIFEKLEETTIWMDW